MRYQPTRQPFVLPPELGGAARASAAPVAIVGAGPVGLAAAIDLASHGVGSVVLDDNDVVSEGSRAICWAKRTLEIFDRLGVADRMLAKGVTWKVGRLFHGPRELWSFDLLPEPGHAMPAFVNLQQYYVEEYLIDRARAFPELIDLRFASRVAGVERLGAGPVDGVRLSVETQAGSYRLEARTCLACDGARSPVRAMLGLGLEGEAFEERFLIADIEMTAAFPSERWFWFAPPFHDGQSALLHKQPDDIYRIDLQLGPDADPEHEARPEVVTPRIERLLDGRPFTLDWVSIYRFQCRRLAQFVHGPVIFAGDSAHVVSPFGARGGNGGVQDIDNLAWKLAAVLRGAAPPALIESYDEERGHAADENLRVSSRSTRFMTPKSEIERMFRDETLALAARHPFARRLVNSGRLSTPASLAGLSLQTPPAEDLFGPIEPGAPCPDAPIADAEGRPGWLLARLAAGRFTLIQRGALSFDPAALTAADVALFELRRTAPRPRRDGAAEPLLDPEGLVAQRLGLDVGMAALIRPDQHVAAVFDAPSAAEILAARDRALGRPSAEARTDAWAEVRA